jgi:hypothetical protein
MGETARRRIGENARYGENLGARATAATSLAQPRRIWARRARRIAQGIIVFGTVSTLDMARARRGSNPARTNAA